MGYSLQKIWSKITQDQSRGIGFGDSRRALTPRHPELFSVLPHHRDGRLKANAHGTTLVDKGTLGGPPAGDILGSTAY
jgi:hypothetical protein